MDRFAGLISEDDTVKAKEVLADIDEHHTAIMACERDHIKILRRVYRKRFTVLERRAIYDWKTRIELSKKRKAERAKK